MSTTDDLNGVEQKRAEARMAIYRAIQDLAIDGHIMVSFAVTCKRCVRTYSVTELSDYGGCACQMDDVELPPASWDCRE